MARATLASSSSSSSAPRRTHNDHQHRDALVNKGDEEDGEDGEDDLPCAPNGQLLRVNPARLVDDVDEEIFLLYTLNAKSQHDGGLGYVNHSCDRIFIAIDGTKWTHSSLSDRNLSGNLVVPIYQDVTSLRSSKGNTGSVVWRSTVELAVRLHSGSIFDLARFRDAVVLELGAGTGALAAMVGGLSGTWIATDQQELVPLMRKNLDQAGPHTVKASALDWFDFLSPPSPHSAQLRRKHILDQITFPTSNHNDNVQNKDNHEGVTAPDIILCCDCIYNPGLFDALIATINVFTQPHKTIVLVSCEMRSDESLAEFLSKWKQSDPSWTIISLEQRFDKGFVSLAAWKS